LDSSEFSIIPIASRPRKISLDEQWRPEAIHHKVSQQYFMNFGDAAQVSKQMEIAPAWLVRDIT
jgi:hypothetical protein